jgi:hypothetical protein
LDLVSNMLYTFGDSMSFGWNLYKVYSEEDRKALAWPGKLSKMLDVPLTDFSFPGASNWRAARILQSLPLTKDDVVVIQWSSFGRTEVGVNPNYQYNSTMHEDEKYKILDGTQEDFGVRTKNLCRTIIPHTTDEFTKKYMYHTFNTFWNEEWFLQMFKVMMSSSLYVLQKSECKFIIFDGWMQHCDINDYRDVPQYIIRGTTMNNITKNITGITEQDLSYGGPEQNQVIADTVYAHLEKIYGL